MPSSKMELQSQSVVSVPLSDEERTSGRMTAEHVGKAVAALHRDGIVALGNAVDVDHMDKLNSLLCSEAAEMAKLPTTHFNDNSVDGKSTGNMSQGPPLVPDLMYDDIWANEPASEVLSAVLGPNPTVNYVNGNTALGGFNGARQLVHADLTFNFNPMPFGVVANYYLVDVSPANGSTELWVGSHKNTTFADMRNCTEEPSQDFGIRFELLEERRVYAPPIQPVLKKGTVVLRDLRLWHAGLSNPSPDPRIMLAFVHTPWWYKAGARVVLPESARSKVESWASRPHAPVAYHAHFVPADLDHKKVKFTPNFNSTNEGYNSILPDLPMGFIFPEAESETVSESKNVTA